MLEQRVVLDQGLMACLTERARVGLRRVQTRDRAIVCAACYAAKFGVMSIALDITDIRDVNGRD